MKYVISIFALCFVSACATPEQIAQEKQIQEQADRETCMSYGLRPRSELFANCLFQLDLARKYQYRSYDSYYPYYGPRVGTGIYFMNR